MTVPRPTLTVGPVHQHLLALTVPMIWGVLALMSFNLADTWFVAQLGELELAAMSFTFPVVMVLLSLGIGLMAGTASVLARLIGRNEPERVRRVTTDALLLAAGLAVVLSLIGLATIEPLFRLLGASDEVLVLIAEYMRVWYAGFALLLVPMVGLGAIRATGDSRLQSRIMMASAGLNLVLDPLLIFGLAGLPRLELQGAALATVLARAMMLVAGYWALARRKQMLTFILPSLQDLRTSWAMVLHVGLPAAGTNIIIPAATAAVVALIAQFGASAVAAFGAATRLEQLVLVVFYAMSAVIGPFVGQNLGAGLHDRIHTAVRQCAVFCLGFGLVCALLLALAGRVLMAQFSDSAEVVGLGAAYLLIVPLSYGAAGIVMVVNAAFNGLGQPLPAVAVSAIRMGALYLPLAWLGGRAGGVVGVFAAACVANLVSGTIAYRWFQQRRSSGAPG